MKTRRSPRSGVVIPLVMLLLVLLVILSAAIMFSSSGEYSQAALVAYGLRAHSLAMGALDESKALVYDRVNRPDPAPAWKPELFAAIVASAGDSPNPQNTGIILHKDIRSDLTTTLSILPADADIVSATVDFFGFRRMAYISTDVYLHDDIYYRDPDGQLDEPAGPTTPAGPKGPREYQGYFRIRIVARFGKVSRTLASLGDVKVVSTVPPAREFALMANMSSAQGGQSYARNDLNSGGGFMVYPYGSGRVFVRGPFVAETEDNTDGTGGFNSTVSTSFFRNTWYGWAMIPATRDGIVSRAGIPLINFAVDPARPESTSGSRPMIDIIRDLAHIFGDDPGWYILDGQSWFCGTKPSSGPDTTTFSVCGNPASGDWGLYRGTLVRRDGATRTVIGPVDNTSQGFRYLLNGWILNQAPGDDEVRWSIEPEGALLSHYNIVRYHYGSIKFCFCIFGCCVMWEWYGLDHAGETFAKMACHWEKAYTESWLSQFASDLLSFGISQITFALTISLTTLPVQLTALLGYDLTALATSTSSVLTNPGTTFQDIKSSMVPDTRPTSRAVTRHYHALADLPSVSGGPDPARPLVLDGVLGFDSISTTKPIIYIGKGQVFCDAPAPQSLVVPIIPAGQRPNTRDYMSIIHDIYDINDIPQANAWNGDKMVTLVNGSGGPEGTLVGSLFATQGVTAPDGQRIRIAGNLACGLINKGHIPGGAHIGVHYQADTLGSPLPAASFKDGSWHQIAISPKITGWFDQ